MQRVKDITKLKLVDGNLLIKIHKKESNIIMPEGSKSSMNNCDYAEVVTLTNSIKDLKVGDIVLDFETTSGFTWEDDIYAMVPRYALKGCVSPDNFVKTYDIST